MQGGTNERDGSQGVKGEVWYAHKLVPPYCTALLYSASQFNVRSARFSGVLYHIGQTEFVREVSQASNDSLVVVHLFHNRYAVLSFLSVIEPCVLVHLNITLFLPSSFGVAPCSVPACRLINAALERVASKQRAVKFVKIIGCEAIKNWPEQNCPAILVYDKTNIMRQFIGIGCGRRSVSRGILHSSIEWTQRTIFPLIPHFVHVCR